MSEAERARLIKALEEFDPSDDYHGEGVLDGQAKGYYAAIDRAIHLVAGSIADWTDGQP